MIIFYNKKTGDILSCVDGRVHDQKTLEMTFDDGTGADNIGKYIIGWEELDEYEDVEEEVQTETFVKDSVNEKGEDIFRKVIGTEKVIRRYHKKKEHNIDKLDLLQKFEDASVFSPMLNCQIDLEKGEIVEIEPKKINKISLTEEQIAERRKKIQEIIKEKRDSKIEVDKQKLREVIS